MHKKTKPKRYYTRTIDLCFLLVLLLIAIYAFYQTISFSILPRSWIMGAMLIFALLFAFLFFLSLQRTKRWIIIAKRIVIVLLCVVLAVPGFFQQKSKSTWNKMNQQADTTIELYVLVKADAAFQSLTELSAQTVGIQNGVDKENAAYAAAQLQQQVSGVQLQEEMDYTSLYNELQIGAIQAMIISENYYRMSQNNIEGFDSSVKTLGTFQRKLTAEAKVEKDISKEPFTVYISGLDNMGSPDQQQRTDTNVLLIVNPRSKHIDMVSLPRDGYMPNTALHNANDKLTHTGIYGIEASVETIENFYQIPIDYYARISFNSLIEIVDAIGGIDVDVEISFCEQDENRSFAAEDLICLEKGEQTINGKEALAYARHRKTAGYDNPGRERAQRRIIQAIIDKLLSVQALTYANKLLDIAPDYVMTNMPTAQVADFISNELENLQPWTISSIPSDMGAYDSRYTASIPQEQGTSNVYLFSREEVHDVINAYDGAYNQLQMREFHFDLNDLYKDTPSLNSDPNIVWDDMVIFPQ